MCIIWGSHARIRIERLKKHVMNSLKEVFFCLESFLLLTVSYAGAGKRLQQQPAQLTHTCPLSPPCLCLPRPVVVVVFVDLPTVAHTLWWELNSGNESAVPGQSRSSAVGPSWEHWLQENVLPFFDAIISSAFAVCLRWMVMTFRISVWKFMK